MPMRFLKTWSGWPKASIHEAGDCRIRPRPDRMIYSMRPLAAMVWRMLRVRHQRSPFSGEGARLYGGRWNMKGWPALYLATEPATALAEFYQDVLQPGTLAPYRLDATAIVDLTDGKGGPVDDAVADAIRTDWKQIAVLDGQVPPSWTLAQQLTAAGAEGALVPSAQNRDGTNLVLWRWREADGSGEGATLALLDPEAALTGRA